ncbi:Protein-tyrosine phosphatase, partial [Ostertagia ostertagi]
DVVCWDATRVQLTHNVPPATDYIHANWVKFDNFDRVYILTQEIENENQKCVMYWPQHAGSFNTYSKVEHQENFVIYTIEVLPEGCSNSHIVKMIHMPNWPDKGMPPSGRHVLRLLRRIVVSWINSSLNSNRKA